MPRHNGGQAWFRQRARGGALLGAIAGLLLAGSLAGCGAVGGCNGLLFAAACTHGPTAVPGGLSEDAAVAAAHRVTPAASSEPALVWAHIENDPFVRSGSDQRLVWEVRLQGSVDAPPCPSGFLDKAATPTDPACLDGDGGLIVVLDYYSGAFVGWLH